MSDNYDKVSLLLPMNGANNGTVFPDWSPAPKTVTVVNSARTSTAQNKYYDSSGDFTASTTARLDVTYSSDLDIGSGDFTAELWARPGATGAARALMDWRNGIGTINRFALISMNTDGKPSLDFGSGSTWYVNILSSIAIAANTWGHIAVTRSGSNFTLWVDGVSSATGSNAGTHTMPSVPLKIGVAADNSSFGYNGYMQDVRITKGVALYTANFTPPARLIGTISNAAVGADKIRDINGNLAERTVIAVPRSYFVDRTAPPRIFSTVSNASGEFEIQAPAGVEHSVVALADEATLYNDIVHRVIPV